LAATSLADGAAFNRASTGSSSPVAEAKARNTAARLAKLHTRPKTAPAARAFRELSLNSSEFMMCSDELVHTVLKESSAKATPRRRRCFGTRRCGGMLRFGSMSVATLDLPAARRE